MHRNCLTAARPNAHVPAVHNQISNLLSTSLIRLNQIDYHLILFKSRKTTVPSRHVHLSNPILASNDIIKYLF